MNSRVTALMNKEMDRKEFLKYGGAVLLAVVGITGLLNTIFNLGGGNQEDRSGGYGGNVYGR